LKTPREVRFALRYVLLNARKHARRDPKGSAAAPASAAFGSAQRGATARGGASINGFPAGFVDSRSSAAWFAGFGRPCELAFGAHAVRAEWLRCSGGTEPPVSEPSSWLLRTGQRRAGHFDLDDTPGV
jgi:hypothetical protein